MARIFTIAELIQKGRRACNQENSDLLSPAEWQDELSSVLSEFQSAIVDGGARVFEETYDFTADGSQNYDLPADFMSELGVDRDDNGTPKELDLVVVQERNVKSNATGPARYYAIVNDTIRLYPAPTSGSYTLVYVPQAPDVSESVTTTEIDVIVPAGEQFFKWSLAAIGAAKEESDHTGYFESKAEKYRQKLMEWSFKRSLTQPHRKVTKSHGLDDGYVEGDWGYDY